LEFYATNKSFLILKKLRGYQVAFNFEEIITRRGLAQFRPEDDQLLAEVTRLHPEVSGSNAGRARSI